MKPHGDIIKSLRGVVFCLNNSDIHNQVLFNPKNIQMQSYYEYIPESVKFAVGKDGDYFYDKYALVTFTRNDKRDYKVEGKTAGLQSHACKHLSEIRPEFVNNIVTQVKNTLSQYIADANHPKDYEFKYYKDFRTEVRGDPQKLLNQAPREAIINFLDLVNDKVMMRRPLAPIEQKMRKYLSVMGDEYMKAINSFMDSAVNLDEIPYEEQAIHDIRTNATVCFWIERMGRDIKVYLNFANRFMILRSYNVVNTGFQLSNTTPDRRSVIGTFLRRFARDSRFYKQSTYRALKTFTGSK